MSRTDYPTSRPVRFPLSKVAVAVSSVLFNSALGLSAHAQDNGPQVEEVLVTGTLIRGVKATGSQTVTVDSERIAEESPLTTNELLSTIPQVANTFNQRPDASPRNPVGNSISRPNLRNLPGFTGASGSTTLVLVDGRRMAPLGIVESSFDPDMISPGVIERVEVVTDGGSSLYGADAIGGVVNFITRKEFEGVKIDLGYGTGQDFDEHNITLTAGKSWENGNGYFSISDSGRDEILRGDRDWAGLGAYDEAGRLQADDTECLEPAGSETRWFWYGAGWTTNPRAPGTGTFPVGTPCDVDGAGSLMPEKTLRNVFGKITHQLSDSVELSVQSYYGSRDLEYSYYPLGDSVSGPAPGDIGLDGDDADENDLYAQPSLGFSYGVHPDYMQRDREAQLETFGILPEITVALGADWQVRSSLYYGRSDNEYVEPDSNFLKLSDYVADGVVDPSDIAAAPTDVINDILNWESSAKTIQEMWSARVLADGPVFSLPAGEVRIAVGAEYTDDEAKTRNGLAGVEVGGLASIDYQSASRDVTSFFAEASIPVLSSLDLSLSVRDDDYSDFGSTTNANVGFSFTPVDWVELYGHWGESFNAPTLVDSLNVVRSRNTPGQWNAADPNNEFASDAEVADPGAPEFGRMPGNLGVMQPLGTGDLSPQTADVWAMGFRIEPPTVQGLQLTANYWEIDFADALGAVNPLVDQAVLANPEKFIFNPTQDEFDAFLALVNNAEETRAFFASLNEDGLPGAIVDRRTDNVDEYELRGVDFGVHYVCDSESGTWNFGLDGVKYLESKAIQADGDTDLLESNAADFTAIARVGWSSGNVRANVNVSYTDGYEVTGTVTEQTSVDDFIVTDVFLGYTFNGGSGITDGLSVRFNIDNVFDEDPPAIERNNTPPDAFTLGRVFRFGITKTFN